MRNSLCKFKIYKYGFTLAEVLITLVIVGVVAAMTIPTLINNTNKQEYVSRIKKTYSTFATVTNKIIAEEGNPKASVGGWASSSENIYNLYKKHLSIAMDCSNGDGCFGTGYYKFLNLGNTDAIGLQKNTRYKVVLADGVSVLFEKIADDCVNNYGGTSDRCAVIDVDVNGAKGPNQWGRDLFGFVIKEDGLVPRGCDDTNWCGSSGTGGYGFGCTCKVLRENAINY